MWYTYLYHDVQHQPKDGIKILDKDLGSCRIRSIPSLNLTSNISYQKAGGSKYYHWYDVSCFIRCDRLSSSSTGIMMMNTLDTCSCKSYWNKIYNFKIQSSHSFISVTPYIDEILNLISWCIISCSKAFNNLQTPFSLTHFFFFFEKSFLLKIFICLIHYQTGTYQSCFLKNAIWN